jgi:hypothetical protein
VCNAEGRKLIDFCGKNGLHILNGKYGSDTVGEFTFVNQLGSRVIDNALASDGIICNVIDFKVEVEIISSPMSLLAELENIMEGEVNTKSDAKSQTQTRNNKIYQCKLIFIYGVQFCLQNSSVEETVTILYCMIRRAGRKMEHRGKDYKELDHWYDEEC